ncbi:MULTISPECIES: hypothetical protein [Kitasatospora]|uniref:hypothetical protein n=1 Tax=Kitasatospora TaxID=2063 RepID=UPI000CBFF48E|nr:hypothetical protein [Kitasatospora sp. GP30]MDH6138226.1 hypothetical protein [Kitasatospora sp. GP30]
MPDLFHLGVAAVCSGGAVYALTIAVVAVSAALSGAPDKRSDARRVLSLLLSRLTRRP